MPWAVIQLASSPPLLTARTRLEPDGAHGALGHQHGRLVVCQAKGFVVVAARRNAPCRAGPRRCAPAWAASRKAFSIALHDLSAKRLVVAAGFGLQLHVVGDDVRGLAAVNVADVARAGLPVLENRGRASRRATSWAMASDAMAMALTPCSGAAPAWAARPFDLDLHAVAAGGGRR